MDKLNETWRKSSRSGGGGGSCVEVRTEGGFIFTRNSNDPDGPQVRYTIAEWEAFIGGVKDNEFEV